MAQKAWPALNSCSGKKHRASVVGCNDQLNHLPDEILLSILSYFTTKEAARASLVSHRWKKLWHCHPCLYFEDSRSRGRIYEHIQRRKFKLVRKERSTYVSRVNHVLEQHVGPIIDEFVIRFDLDNSYQSDIDKWVVFALAKQVKRLELDLQPIFDRTQYTLPLDCCKPLELPHNLASILPALTSLSLTYVNITEGVVECFLSCFPYLENLCIKQSEYLTSIRSSGSPVPLKHLEVSFCRRMETIDIAAPKLLSFVYKGAPIGLHIRNASLLSEISVGGFRRTDPIAYAFDSLAMYFRHLEYLQVQICIQAQLNLVISNFPALTNLKHLELYVNAKCTQSLLGWTPLIEASPALQKLTLKLSTLDSKLPRAIEKRNEHQLKCLKVLEIVGFVGRPIDLELATYVLENAVMLEDVIVDVTQPNSLEPNKKALGRAIELRRQLPKGVKFTFK